MAEVQVRYDGRGTSGRLARHPRRRRCQPLPSHCMPWCITPYRSEPQWSQKVGLLYVCTLKRCLVRESCRYTHIGLPQPRTPHTSPREVRLPHVNETTDCLWETNLSNLEADISNYTKDKYFNKTSHITDSKSEETVWRKLSLSKCI